MTELKVGVRAILISKGECPALGIAVRVREHTVNPDEQAGWLVSPAPLPTDRKWFIPTDTLTTRIDGVTYTLVPLNDPRAVDFRAAQAVTTLTESWTDTELTTLTGARAQLDQCEQDIQLYRNYLAAIERGTV